MKSIKIYFTAPLFLFGAIACQQGASEDENKKTDAAPPSEAVVLKRLDSLDRKLMEASKKSSSTKDMKKQLTQQMIMNASILANEYPKNEKAPSYLYLAATNSMANLTMSKANKMYSLIIKKFPDFEYLEKAYYFKAYTLDEMRKKEKAVETYKKLLKKYPETTFKKGVEERLKNIDTPIGKVDASSKETS